MNVVRASLWFVLGVALAGCSRSESEPTPAGEHPSSVASGAVHETANYRVTIEPVGPYEKGKDGVVNVVLVTKGDYHINDQYPYKFVCQEPAAEGIDYTKKVVRRADGKFDKARAELPITFKAERTGTLKVGGILSLSVCNASNCLMDKRPLVLDVTIP